MNEFLACETQIQLPKFDDQGGACHACPVVRSIAAELQLWHEEIGKAEAFPARDAASTAAGS